eukprot:PhM_4_TR17829/c0_g1_i1/m.68925/K03782/katG; catalase-peroxidase
MNSFTKAFLLFVGVVLMSTAPAPAIAGCPFGFSAKPRTPVTTSPDADRVAAYGKALAALDWDSVKQDIKALLTESKPFWPADYGNYGPFFVRQAWHCSGSYRSSDGLGGCDGARQRFNPELSWADNTNLDKAKTLLWPIKQKYGLGLSWGDLIVLAGTTAIETMGGPVLGFCGGRIDDDNGDWSKLLGPTKQQEARHPCPVNGKCPVPPFGTSTIGLIYVNPEGPMGVPDPAGSAPEVRLTFGTMGMNDTETVALIGGGHTFGKTHGACPAGPGPSPKEDPSNPWPGLCPNGTFTSGFEGAWTTTPTKWSNEYFRSLASKTFSKAKGPGGHYQWSPSDATPIIMLTTDISLTVDGVYNGLVQKYANDISAMENDFKHAWYKLVSRDMGPVSRCSGPWVPPAQEFQYPLPAAPTNPPNFDDVANDIAAAMRTKNPALAPDTLEDGTAYYGAVFTTLAWQCAATFRVADYIGGCNGARIRLAPQSTWATNVAMDKALDVLASVKNKYGDNLSWADTIVLAGNVALRNAAGTNTAFNITFCGGRSDATTAIPEMYLTSMVGNYSMTLQNMKDEQMRLALTDAQYVALQARLRSPGQLSRLGYTNVAALNRPNVLSNAYFNTLLSSKWTPVVDAHSGETVHVASSGNVVALQTDVNLVYHAPYLAHVRDFASDNQYFLTTFAAAWTRLMNADRFNGSTGNVCYQ